MRGRGIQPGHPLHFGEQALVRGQREDDAGLGLVFHRRPAPAPEVRIVIGLVAAELLQQLGDDGGPAVGFDEFGDGGQRAEFELDLLHGRDGGSLLVVAGVPAVAAAAALGAGLARQGEGGDLQAVEQQAGAARVKLIAGDALQDLGDGGLQTAAVGEVIGQVEDGLLRAAAFLVGLAGLQFAEPDGPAAGVMVVAKIFFAEARAAAAEAVGEDVTALETGLGVRLDAGIRSGHVGSPSPWGFCVKSSRYWA